MEKDLKSYLEMSPFEIKNELIAAAEKAVIDAQSKGEKARMLNAGRGNPNFLNTTVRKAFSYLEKFVTDLSDSLIQTPDVGMRPKKEGIAEKFSQFLKANPCAETDFLQKAVEYVGETFAAEPDDFVFEIADAALGDFYPSPPRIFPYCEKIVNAYLNDILFLGHDTTNMPFDLFATEGASAGMIYIFNSLKINHLLKEGDKIAIFTPIFSPYLEIPMLKEFSFEPIYIKAEEDLDWQIPDSEIDKLKDPKIKIAYLVNPTNPTSVALRDSSIEKIAKLVNTHRKDLIFLTDTVYAPFVDSFHSVMKEMSHNTIMVYSYSKYFGVTGWRLGVIMLHHDNVIDKLIADLPSKHKKELHERYKTVSANPEELKFIERLEMDSRDEALAHTGGLSCPQQAIMTLFSLFNLLDTTHQYKKAVHEILKKRISLFYDNLGVSIPTEMGHTYYYMVFDIHHYALVMYGDEFANFLMNELDPIEFIFRLAEEKYIICLPGEGFAAPSWSIRISLANLDDDAYKTIGISLRELIVEYHDQWKKSH